MILLYYLKVFYYLYFLLVQSGGLFRILDGQLNKMNKGYIFRYLFYITGESATITWAHHSIVAKDRKSALFSLYITIFLAAIFTLLQGYEYLHSGFTIADGVYGSTFYMATGFHGLHVIIGTIFIAIQTLRLNNYHFTNHHHIGFEAAAWYWHFVDVVWLFLFVTIYWWGS